MKQENLGICSKCKSPYYEETIYDSHGCLGIEETVVIVCNCIAEDVNEYKNRNLIEEFNDEEMPF